MSELDWSDWSNEDAGFYNLLAQETISALNDDVADECSSTNVANTLNHTATNCDIR